MRPFNEPDENIDEPRGAECNDCGLPYEEFGLDFTLPDLQWHELTPDGAGLLCANCICKRAARKKNVLAIRGTVEVMWPKNEQE